MADVAKTGNELLRWLQVAPVELVTDLPESYIDQGQQVLDLVGRLRDRGETWCTVDTEADSMHSYETKLCLIQFATPHEMVLIDPLAMSRQDLMPLMHYLDEAEGVWMHGADYDMALFLQTFGFVPKNIWDTQTAARLTGADKFGLGSLIESEFGVVLSKQSQKADWGRRPLSDKMVTYAYNDVRYLLTMGAKLIERLKEVDRLHWFEESCRAARRDVLQREERPKDDAWRINGWGKLSHKELMYLHALWQWRDDECRRLDRPAFKFLGNAQLMQMVNQLGSGQAVEPPHYIRSGAARRLTDAVAAAGEVAEADWPEKRPERSGKRLKVNESAFQSLRSRRNDIAVQLGIDATLMGSRSVLERLTADDRDDKPSDLLLKWQKDLLYADGAD
ncbi:MAG: hypothetical protein QM496_14975 [Verrucomicrobiota bacterium]